MPPQSPLRGMEMDLAELKQFTQSRKWKEELASGKGLFEVSRERPPKGVVGPTLSEGSISGDLLLMETAFFHCVAAPAQIKFFEGLQKANPRASVEYMLAISGSLPIWKHDIMVLQHILEVLTEGERFLEREQKIIKSAANIGVEKGLFEILEKHLPHIIQGVPRESLSLQDEIQAIPQLESKIKDIREELNDYLQKKKEEMLFLFEK